VRDWRMRTDARITADELALTMRGLLGAHADEVTGVAALSTVPPYCANCGSCWAATTTRCRG
jgi:pantothenate kinase type III